MLAIDVTCISKSELAKPAFHLFRWQTSNMTFMPRICSTWLRTAAGLGSEAAAAEVCFPLSESAR
jgi:hypothetical protein